MAQINRLLADWEFVTTQNITAEYTCLSLRESQRAGCFSSHALCTNKFLKLSHLSQDRDLEIAFLLLLELRLERGTFRTCCHTQSWIQRM